MAMHIIARSTLVDFADKHPAAKRPLDAWFKVASSATWIDFAQLRETYPHADLVGRLTVFNIGGNKYRLITKITYARGGASGTIYIRSVLTHAEYDQEGWKRDPWF
jgi:mRNA interferase HigB